jgi:hypothetical protein
MTAGDRFLSEKSDFSQFLQADIWDGTASSFMVLLSHLQIDV